MNDHSRDRVPTGRDVAVAWLFCFLIAGLALGLSAYLPRDVPPAATVAATTSPCPPRQASRCPGLGEDTLTRESAVPGLHRLALPMPRPDLARPG
jgi:hypothetical protein